MKRFWGWDPFGRPGGDLLSHVLRRSTIGAEGFHGRVRDGIGWDTLAITTKPSKRTLVPAGKTVSFRLICKGCFPSIRGFVTTHERSEAYRAISTG